MPVPMFWVAMYIVHLEQRGLQATTIRSMLSPIAYAHRVRELSDPTAAFLISKLLKAVDKKPKSADPRLPITADLLVALLGAWAKNATSWWDLVLYSTIFVVAYHGALRVSEYVWIKAAPPRGACREC